MWFGLQPTRQACRSMGFPVAEVVVMCAPFQADPATQDGSHPCHACDDALHPHPHPVDGVMGPRISRAQRVAPRGFAHERLIDLIVFASWVIRWMAPLAAPCPLAGIWMNSKGIFKPLAFSKKIRPQGLRPCTPAPHRCSFRSSFVIRHSSFHSRSAPVTSSLPSLRSVADSVPVAPRPAA